MHDIHSDSSKSCSKVIALSGNPNVGKSTLFNGMTGMKQHTGNWPGKTVAKASGFFTYKNSSFTLIDLPGTYSLLSHSPEEEIARDFLLFQKPDIVVVVCDATCLMRNLNLLLQTVEIHPNVIACVNLMDEAGKKDISVNLKTLSSLLQIPVIGTSAQKNKGLNALMETIYRLSEQPKPVFPFYMNPIPYPKKLCEQISNLESLLDNYAPANINTRWLALRLLAKDSSIIKSLKNNLDFDIADYPEISEEILALTHIFNEEHTDIEAIITSCILKKSNDLYTQSVVLNNPQYYQRDLKIDKVLTSPLSGIPIMLLLLMGIFWLTMVGANYPSNILSGFLFSLEEYFELFFTAIDLPKLPQNFLIYGVYHVMAWVVSVMLPPMAIFFPLFTLLEDLGYLPRVAFNLDHCFKRACACGKQALTMCMGLGCNAVGVTGCRIIDSPRERLIAILTNSFVPCNGRFAQPSKGQYLLL